MSDQQTAGQVLQAYVATQVAELRSRQRDVVADAPDAVHKARVATRRLRSLLKTFRDLLDAAQTEPLRAELTWWAGVLGAPRDAEVQRERLIAAVEELPRQWQRGPVVARIRTELNDLHATAHAALVAEMDGERARALFARLEEVAVDLPVAPEAHGPAAHLLLPYVERACRAVDKAAARARATSGAESLTWWHEARKKAKAARYAADAMVDAFGKPAKQLGSAYAGVTEALGELQDAVVAAEWLVDLARVADGHQESTVTYWHLVEEEHQHARGFIKAGEKALAAVERSGTREWARQA